VLKTSHRPANNISSGRALLCGLLLFAAPAHGAAQTGPPPGRKDLERAERVLSRLGLMRAAASAPDGRRALCDLRGRFYPALFVTVAEMKPGDLKTELDTAVFFYESAACPRRGAGEATADCEAQRPDTYGSLCVGLGGASVRELSLAKARLHTRWAEALLAHHRGRDDDETARLISELRSAREVDLLIAGAALEDCRRLSEMFVRFEDSGRGNARWYKGIGRDGLTEGAAMLIARSQMRVASLPRSPLRYGIENALSSYRDGLYWLGQLERSTAKVVSLDATRFNPLDALDVRAVSAGATVTANFARGSAYTARAESLLLQSR
jgi:hypothetical protein